MSESPESSAAPESQGVVGDVFRLESVVPTDSPDGSDGQWFRYVIVQGTNVITGLRSGTLSELDPVLRDMVARLNERAGKQRAKQYK